MEPVYLEMSQVKENDSHSVELQWTSIFLQVLWSSKSNNSELKQPEQVLTVQDKYLDLFAIPKPSITQEVEWRCFIFGETVMCVKNTGGPVYNVF